MGSKRWRIALAATVATVGATTVTAATVSGRSPQPEPGEARAAIKNVQGQLVANVRLVPRPDRGVEVRVSGAGISPGFHGFHVHERGVCDPASTDASGAPAPFTSAGGHFQSGSQVHAGHLGDFPPLLVTSGGRSRAVFITDRFTIAQLIDADGSALIIHAQPDNQGNIPSRYQSPTGTGPDSATLATGDSGARFGCGVVMRETG
jgi:Cu-Zn family superoxide dismutase